MMRQATNCMCKIVSSMELKSKSGDARVFYFVIQKQLLIFSHLNLRPHSLENGFSKIQINFEKVFFQNGLDYSITL